MPPPPPTTSSTNNTTSTPRFLFLQSALFMGIGSVPPPARPRRWGAVKTARTVHTRSDAASETAPRLAETVDGDRRRGRRDEREREGGRENAGGGGGCCGGEEGEGRGGCCQMQTNANIGTVREGARCLAQHSGARPRLCRQILSAAHSECWSIDRNM